MSQTPHETAQKHFERLHSQWTTGKTGQGAWFWCHLKPVLVCDDDGRAKDAKLQCEHCGKYFSARNPSRTSVEHLKSGACEDFRKTATYDSLQKTSKKPARKGRRRSASGGGGRLQKKEEDAVVGLQTLSQKRRRIAGDAADDGEGCYLAEEDQRAAERALADFFFEASDGVSLSLISHPKFLQFCHALGFVPVTKDFLAGPLLDARYAELRAQVEDRLRKSFLFQCATDGWQKRTPDNTFSTKMINIMINFPEGHPAFHRAVDTGGVPLHSDCMRGILMEATEELAANMDKTNCLGWVSDFQKVNRATLAELELRYPWMVNICCQSFAFHSLLKDLMKHLECAREAAEACLRISNFFTSHPKELLIVKEKQLAECPTALPLYPPRGEDPVLSRAIVIARVWESRWALHQTVLDVRFNGMSDEACWVTSKIFDVQFWNNIDKIRGLLKPILDTCKYMDSTRPYLSHCLPVWNNLMALIGSWVSATGGELGDRVMLILKKRFAKSYHPAMAAAFVLDPGFAEKSGDKYSPPFSVLTQDQRQHVFDVCKRLLPPVIPQHSPAPVSLPSLTIQATPHTIHTPNPTATPTPQVERPSKLASELAEWEMTGLPQDFGEVVADRAMEDHGHLPKLVPMALRKTAWSSCLKHLELLGPVAQKVLSLRATARGPQRDWSRWKQAMIGDESRAALAGASKLLYISSNAKLKQNKLEDEFVQDLELLAEPWSGHLEQPPPATQSLPGTFPPPTQQHTHQHPQQHPQQIQAPLNPMVTPTMPPGPVHIDQQMIPSLPMPNTVGMQEAGVYPTSIQLQMLQSPVSIPPITVPQTPQSLVVSTTTLPLSPPLVQIPEAFGAKEALLGTENNGGGQPSSVPVSGPDAPDLLMSMTAAMADAGHPPVSEGAAVKLGDVSEGMACLPGVEDLGQSIAECTGQPSTAQSTEQPAGEVAVEGEAQTTGQQGEGPGAGQSTVQSTGGGQPDSMDVDAVKEIGANNGPVQGVGNSEGVEAQVSGEPQGESMTGLLEMKENSDAFEMKKFQKSAGVDMTAEAS